VSWTAWVSVLVTLVAAGALMLQRERAKAGALAVAVFVSEVKAEVFKITWPTRDDLKKATMVVLAFVVVVALIIGTMDIVLQWLLVRLPSRAA
jgi:preprotein translocase subunit SecE